MRFNSVQFLIFFPVVVLGYFVVPQKAKNIWLLIASYYFYMSWHPVYALLIFFSTASTYLCASFIEKTDSPAKRKGILAAGIILNLGILFYFKYYDFFADSIMAAFPQITIAKSSNMIAVVGISFYTLQSLGYMIDVFNGKTETEKDFLTYSLFVSFFPKLFEGPIEKASNLLPQLHETYRFDYDRVTDGLVLMAWGYFKKVVIADGAALIVDLVYNDIGAYSGWEIIAATFFYAIQIYGDFSGYSDIAIGAANVLGIKLTRNFRHPYFAKDINDFWKRWHISLTDWLREYIYFPLGGSRKGKLRKYLNIFIVFLVSGLWHGAAWTYVIWGALHGLFRVINAVKLEIIAKSEKLVKISENKIVGVFKTAVTFLIVCFTWIFFRANTVADAFYAVQNLFTDFSCVTIQGYFIDVLTGIGFYENNGIRLVCCILFMAAAEIREGKGELTEKINGAPFPVRWLFYYAVMLLILFFGSFGQSAFIYFQF